MGDREFTDYLNRKVNLRRVAYLGSGQLDIPEEHHMVYGAYGRGRVAFLSAPLAYVWSTVRTSADARLVPLCLLGMPSLHATTMTPTNAPQASVTS